MAVPELFVSTKVVNRKQHEIMLILIIGLKPLQTHRYISLKSTQASRRSSV